MKNSALIIFAVIVLVGIFLGLQVGQKDKNEINETPAIETSDEVAVEEVVVKKEVSGSERVYAIQSSSSASYIVQKEWFSKPKEEVTGTTSSIIGTITIDVEKKTISGDIIIDPSTLTTGISGRDKDVKKLFTGPITVVAPAVSIPTVEGDFSAVLNAEVSINGVPQTLPFTIAGNISDNVLFLSGNTNFTISSFGINPPSALEVFSVADKAIMKFDFTAHQ